MSQNSGDFQSKSKKNHGKPRSSSGGYGKSGGKGGRTSDRPTGSARRDDNRSGGYSGGRSDSRGDTRGDYKGRNSGGRSDTRFDTRSNTRSDPRAGRDERDHDNKRPYNNRSNDRKPRGDGDGFKKSYDRKPRRDGDSDRDFKPRGDRPSSGGRKDLNKERDDRRRKDRRDRDTQKTFLRPPREDYKRQEATDETKEFLKTRRASYGAPSPAFLYGIHPVSAALLNPKRTVNRLLVTEKGFENIKDAYNEAINQGLQRPEPIFVEKEDLNRLVSRDAVHQDIVLDAGSEEEVFLNDILIASDDDTKIIILDQVTDPHNVGAILRSASAFGASAVVVQKLHAPDITGVLAKSASGAVEYVPIIREVNLSRAMEQMKESGFFCIGLDERGEYSVSKTAPKKTKIALVLGAEGDGLRRLVSENCDALAKLPTQGPIASLNVSNAAAVALYELVREND